MQGLTLDTGLTSVQVARRMMNGASLEGTATSLLAAWAPASFAEAMQTRCLAVLAVCRLVATPCNCTDARDILCITFCFFLCYSSEREMMLAYFSGLDDIQAGDYLWCGVWNAQMHGRRCRSA